MSAHFASAHYASAHFLSAHFGAGTAQVIEAVFNAGEYDVLDQLQRLPNGHIIAIAAGALIIIEDDLEHG